MLNCASLFLPKIPLFAAACIKHRSLSAYIPFASVSAMAMAGGEVRRFKLSPSGSLVIVKGDITVWSVNGSTDAIVNPANRLMLGGGGADGAIHRAAGPELRDACWNVPEVSSGVRCPTGEARITGGFRLPASHVIHTVGPVYDEDDQPQVSLKEASSVAISVIKEFSDDIKEVHFVLFSDDIYKVWVESAMELIQT